MGFLRRFMRGLALTVLLLLCAALFYLMVIMGDTKEPDTITETSPTVGPLAALPKSSMEFTEDTLYQAAYYFNAPVLTLDENDWRLHWIEVWDSIPEGVDVTVRGIRLHYESADGAIVEVSSLTPARYLRTLPARGFYTALDQEWVLAGEKAVFMSMGQTLHLHIQKGEYVYQIQGDVSVDMLRQAAGAGKL